MWPIVIVLILVCGHYYVDTHLPSKYKLKKAVGWNAYFLVAVKGFEFLMAGWLLALFILVFLYISMFILNIPAYIFKWYKPFSYVTYLVDHFRVSSLSFWSWLWLGSTVFLSFVSRESTRKVYKNLNNRIKGFKEIAKDNAVEGIILESLEKMSDGILLFVTLKSRKVYVGMVDGARFEGMDTNSLVLIPFLSGYRSEETLTFHVEHDYSEHYTKFNITSDSKPLSFDHFRHVLPLIEIESFSLFNIDTYMAFQAEKDKIANKD